MDRGTDSEVLQAAMAWLAEGDPVTLATVTRTWGSAPRRPGALMVMHPDGRFVGSVSGGCVEDDLVRRLQQGEFDPASPHQVDYGVTPGDTGRVGLPCGGRLSLLLETVTAAGPLRQILNTVASRQLIARRVCLDTGEASLHPATPNQPELQFDGRNLVKCFGPRWHLVLIGAGELSRRVAQLAQTLDYAVTLYDPRPEYAHHWQLSDTELVTRNPGDSLSFDPRTAVLALAHTALIEDDVLKHALQSDAFYVGALGSVKTQRARCRRLRELGITASQLARLEGPAGLNIGSRTPAEIAVAMVAGLIAVRHAQANNAPGTARLHG